LQQILHPTFLFSHSMNRPARNLIYLPIFFCLLLITFVNTSIANGTSADPEKLISLALMQLESNELDRAMLNFRAAINQTQISTQAATHVRAYLGIADIKRIRQEFDSSYHYLEKSREILQSPDFQQTPLMADYHHKLGATYLD
jgi:hypothetical protein